MKRVLIFCCFLFSLNAAAQFAPPAGQTGSTAIYKDSSVFVAWASGCHIVRGYQDISNTSLGYASSGDSSMVIGIAGGGTVVSLGDSGYAIVTFNTPIMNGAGWDFAIFENSFDGNFLELAFVEVSSDGNTFYRFPAASLTPDNVQTGSFGLTNATKLNNLAGKYRANYGTPFDLEEVKNKPALDVNHITHIKIIDVVGSIQAQYGTKDTSGSFVNDPWPTAFPSGGFDLDAVGVINQSPNAIKKINHLPVSFYPNPATDIISVQTNSASPTLLQITNMNGEVLFSKTISNSGSINCSAFTNGIYFLTTEIENNKHYSKLVIAH